MLRLVSAAAVLPSTELDATFPGLRGTHEEAAAVLSTLGAMGPTALGDLLAVFPARRRAFVRGSVMWLAKAGLVDWLP